MSEELKWEKVSEKHLVEDEWIDFRSVRYRFPDGREFEPFYQYSRRSYVVVIARETNGKYLCVKQFRHGISKITTEFPAGGIEVNYHDAAAITRETALEAAKRELREETGYVSDAWTSLMKIPSNATIADNYAYLFFADACKKASDLSLDETEFLEPFLLDEKEIDNLIEEEQFLQAIHVAGWLYAKQKGLTKEG